MAFGRTPCGMFKIPGIPPSVRRRLRAPRLPGVVYPLGKVNRVYSQQTPTGTYSPSLSALYFAAVLEYLEAEVFEHPRPPPLPLDLSLRARISSTQPPEEFGLPDNGPLESSSFFDEDIDFSDNNNHFGLPYVDGDLYHSYIGSPSTSPVFEHSYDGSLADLWFGSNCMDQPRNVDGASTSLFDGNIHLLSSDSSSSSSSDDDDNDEDEGNLAGADIPKSTTAAGEGGPNEGTAPTKDIENNAQDDN